MAGRDWSLFKPHLGVAVSAAALLAACSGTGGGDTASRSRLNRPAFTEEEYGVSTSPRVAEHRGTMPKGGGGFKLGSPYKVAGRWYVPREEPGYDRSGIGSWYGDDFHGRKTANGEIFDMHALTAAHPTLPLPSYVYVTNLDNGRTILVRVNDRGPYVNDRIIDLSHASARALGYEGQGRARVRVRYAGRAPLNGDDRRERQFIAEQQWYRGGKRNMMAVAAMPARDAPISAPEPFPAGTPGRWSPAAYRANLAGKPLPAGFARAPQPQPSPVRPEGRMAVTAANESAGTTPWSAGTAAGQGSAPGGREEERLVWKASPRAPVPSLSYTGATGRDHTGNAPGGPTVYVQVGLFKNRAEAEQMRVTVGDMGPVEVAAVGAAAQSSYRVRIGPMPRDDAQAALAALSARGHRGGSVIVE